jgi:type II secretory pathway pseudopilin PulG
MKNIQGFTLIEVAAIVTIMAIMTAAIFANYGKNNDIFALERSSQKLAQDFRRTQEMAMSGFEGSSATNGYGIYFNNASSGQYLIYEEKNANMYYESGTDSIKETVSLEKGIVICNITDNSSVMNYLSVSFEPPNPTTYIGGISSGHVASISLCISSDLTQKKIINVNNVGMVEITNP